MPETTTTTPPNVRELCLYAWVGEDEFGSGAVGIKRGLVPAGCVPLVAVDAEKVNREFIVEQLRVLSHSYGKTIRLCKFVFAEEILTVVPETEGVNP